MGVLLLIFLFIASNGQSISQQQIDVNNLMNNNMDLVDSLLDSAIVQFVKVIETYSNKYQPFGLKLTNFIHINAKKQLPGGADLISKVRTDISNVAPVVNFFHVYNSVEILRITTRKNIFQAYKKVIATELLGNETAGPPCLAQLLYILTYKAILVTTAIKSHLSFTLNILQPQIETLNSDFDSYQASIISQVKELCKSDQKCAIKHVSSFLLHYVWL